jgi:16S rRNA (guanine966-N2)-methyltransferase
VRESLFGSLTHMTDLDGCRFLDLYAGSGAVGLEALSRGADRATFVERSAAALGVLRENISSLGVQHSCEVVTSPVLTYLKRQAAAEAYDVVFLDPPYESPIDADLEALAAGGWLADQAIVITERSSRGAEPAAPALLTLETTRTYGETRLSYFTFAAAAPGLPG